EIIFVVDDSTDDTCLRVAALRARDKRVRLVSLTRSFGHQAALLAGLQRARGSAVISMDCDLQHPPALIPDMVAAWRAGALVVETIRDDTLDAGWRKRITSRLFYRFMNMLSSTPITPGAADFRLLDRRPLNDLLRLRDQRLFLRGMIAWLGYPCASLHYVAGARAAGRSSYSTRKLIVLAADAITAFSAKPLRAAFYVGVVTSLLALCYVALIAYRWSQGEIVQGWTSLMLAVLFLGATQLMTLGIVGEYIGRITTVRFKTREIQLVIVVCNFETVGLARKCRLDLDLFKNRHRKDLQQCVERRLQPEPFAHDRNQHIDRNGDPDLRLHGVLRRAIEPFDPQVLFDPFEKK